MAAESEAVGQFALQRIPVLRLFLLGQLEQGVVVSLELLVVLGRSCVVSPAGASIACLLPATAAATSSVLALHKAVLVHAD